MPEADVSNLVAYVRQFRDALAAFRTLTRTSYTLATFDDLRKRIGQALFEMLASWDGIQAWFKGAEKDGFNPRPWQTPLTRLSLALNALMDSGKLCCTGSEHLRGLVHIHEHSRPWGSRKSRRISVRSRARGLKQARMELESIWARADQSIPRIVDANFNLAVEEFDRIQVAMVEGKNNDRKAGSGGKHPHKGKTRPGRKGYTRDEEQTARKALKDLDKCKGSVKDCHEKYRHEIEDLKRFRNWRSSRKSRGKL